MKCLLARIFASLWRRFESYEHACLVFALNFELRALLNKKALDNIDLNQMSHRYVSGVLQND